MLISQSDCLEILKNFLQTTNDKFQLLDYELQMDNASKGYLGDYYALHLSYSTAANSNAQTQEFFVKALPQKSDEVEKEAIFHKEARLYETVLKDMQKASQIKWSAKCYYTRADLFVLENIKLIGYTAVSATLLNEHQMQQLLRTVAAFHAASLAYEQRSGKNIGQEFGGQLQEITVAANIAWFTTGLSAVLAVLRSLPQYQSTEYVNFINNQLPGILERVYEQSSPSTRYRNVLCHRDLWAGNIFFPAKCQDAVVLIDYQTCRYAPPGIDLSFTLYMNLTIKDRKRVEIKYIDYYYNWLRMDLEDLCLQPDQFITKSELLESYEEFRLFSSIYSAVAATIVQVPKSFVTNKFKYIDRSDVILDYMQQNAEFRNSMEQWCAEVMDTCMACL